MCVSVCLCVFVCTLFCVSMSSDNCEYFYVWDEVTNTTREYLATDIIHTRP